MIRMTPEYIEKASKQTAMIQATIESLREFNVSDDKIKEHLIAKFHLTPIYTQNCLDADWDDDDL